MSRIFSVRFQWLGRGTKRRRKIASRDDDPSFAGTEVTRMEFLECLQDLAPRTGIDVQLHNPVRQPFLAISFHFTPEKLLRFDSC
jgi:hypothetical protein